jgi:hypothetical protein
MDCLWCGAQLAIWPKDSIMAGKVKFFIKRADGTEEGPLDVSQVNRQKQGGKITASTPCRREGETAFLAIGQMFPHLRDREGMTPAKMAALKERIGEDDVRSLVATAYGGVALSLLPRIGSLGVLSALACGTVLIVKYRRWSGVGAVAFGLGLMVLNYYWYRWETGR